MRPANRPLDSGRCAVPCDENMESLDPLQGADEIAPAAFFSPLAGPVPLRPPGRCDDPLARSIVRIGIARDANTSTTASQVRPAEALTGVASRGTVVSAPSLIAASNSLSRTFLVLHSINCESSFLTPPCVQRTVTLTVDERCPLARTPGRPRSASNAESGNPPTLPSAHCGGGRSLWRRFTNTDTASQCGRGPRRIPRTSGIPRDAHLIQPSRFGASRGIADAGVARPSP